MSQTPENQTPAFNPAEDYLDEKDLIQPTAKEDPPVVQEPDPTPILEAAAPEPTVSAEKKEDEPKVRQKQKVTLPYPVTIKADIPADGIHLYLPSNFDEETANIIQGLPNIDMTDSDLSRDWIEALRMGLQLNTYDEMFVPTLTDGKTEFSQELDYKGTKISGKEPKFSQIENESLKGERSVLRLASHLGLGTPWTAPMFHSGFHVTFKPPTEMEMVEFNRMIVADRIVMGRRTYGLAFSAVTAYQVDRVIDFAIDHIYNLTTKNEDINLGNIKEHLSSLDIPSFIWGFACTMYPRGFRYSRACTTDPEKCNHVEEALLNLRKIQHPATNVLTDWQLAHMASTQPKMKDMASITRYKEELTRAHKKRIVINEGTEQELAINLKVPNTQEYVESSHRWIGDIVNMVNQTLAEDASNDERNRLITRHSQASAMRHLSHWVESIEFRSNTIDDRESLEKNLDMISANDDIRDKYETEIKRFINEATMTVIGIPVYDCPRCNGTQPHNHNFQHHQNILPLDTVQLFFDLLTQRLGRLTNR